MHRIYTTWRNIYPVHDTRRILVIFVERKNPYFRLISLVARRKIISVFPQPISLATK